MTLHEMWQVQNKHKKPGFILAISFDGCASSSRKEVQKYQKSLIYQTSLIEGSFAGRALMSPEKLFHSRKVLRATTKVKAQAKRRFLQTGTVSFRRRHVQLVFSDVFGMWLCSSNGSGRVRFSPTFWRLAEFFGPIKSEKMLCHFVEKSHKKLGTANLKVSRNWTWQWKLNMLLIKLSHVLWSRSQFGLVVLVARVEERMSVMIVFTSKIEDIERHRHQHLDQTSTYLSMLRCNTLQPLYAFVAMSCP